MKNCILFVLLMFVPVLAMAQASGGQIKRHANTTNGSKKNVNSKKIKSVEFIKCERCGNALKASQFTVFESVCDNCIQLKIHNQTESPDKWGRISVGMSEDDVRLVIGEPRYMARSEKGFYDWIYKRSRGWLIVQFDEKNNKLLKWYIYKN